MTSLNFVKFTKLYFFISAVFIIPGVVSLALYGLKPAIDFTGGSLVEIQFTNQESAPQLSVLESDQTIPIDIASVQQTSASYIFRSQPISQQQADQLLTTLSDQYGPVDLVRFETIGPTLGAQLLKKTLTAVGLATIAILLYIGYQFKDLKYGVSAILAMFHDTVIVIGAFSILGHFYGIQVDTLFVTAVLTILSFSVHDTIVVYDRIRESLRIHSRASFEQIANKAIAETLSRSINNSLTIIFMLVSLFLLGGPTIKWFIFALLIGTVTGTYSSTFTATPILVVWHRLRTKTSQSH